jgi:hypothetical protein
MRAADCEFIAHARNDIEWLLDQLNQAEPSSKKQIGWFDPGSKRFCYTDEKEHRQSGMPAYTIPVYAIEEPKAASRNGHLPTTPQDHIQPPTPKPPKK